jgi:hypothetical protein
MLRSGRLSRTRRLLPIVLAGAALVAAMPARFGPPWISIESPANPHDRATRGAVLVAHTYHHGTPLHQGVTGTAEGLVNGQRRGVRLAFTQLAQPGAYALHRQWPTEGRWALVITTGGGDGGAGGASALVRLDAAGQVASVTVPTRRQNGWEIPRTVTAAEVDALLHRPLGGDVAGQ